MYHAGQLLPDYGNRGFDKLLATDEGYVMFAVTMSDLAAGEQILTSYSTMIHSERAVRVA